MLSTVVSKGISNRAFLQVYVIVHMWISLTERDRTGETDRDLGR